MLAFLEPFLLPEVYAALCDILPQKVVNSFDCARFSMGVAQVTIDPVVVLPPVRTRGHTPEESIRILEAHIEHVSWCIDNLIRVDYLGVWKLGKNDAELHDPWAVAPPLRTRLDKLDTKFGSPDTLLYEFQMGANDKSRTVSSMLVYHYSGKPTVRIPPAVKNTLCPVRALTRAEFERCCPRVATKRKKNVLTGKLTTIADLIYSKKDDRKDLNIQTFLAIVTDTYDANKLHTSACLEWWASWFRVDMRYVPADCLDDAADAFMQIQGALRKRLL
jgi:hypothetical protein